MPFQLISLRDLATARVPTRLATAVALMASLSGCSVLAVADAAVTVASTAVSVTATVVETTVDVAAAGVRAATADDKDPKKADDSEKTEKTEKTEEKQGADQNQAPAQETPATPQRAWQPPEWPVNR